MAGYGILSFLVQHLESMSVNGLHDGVGDNPRIKDEYTYPASLLRVHDGTSHHLQEQDTTSRTGSSQ